MRLRLWRDRLPAPLYRAPRSTYNPRPSDRSRGESCAPGGREDGQTGRSRCVAKRTPLAEKLDEVKQRIANAAAKAKRDPSEVTLVAVTKTAAPEQIREILQLGVADLGESRVQVLQQRAAQINEFLARKQAHGSGEEAMPPKLRWHMIGHLQRNKIKPILPL